MYRTDIRQTKASLNASALWGRRHNNATTSTNTTTNTTNSSRGLVIEATYLHPASLGSTPIGTDRSHWWRQEGHPAKTAPVHQ